MPNSAKRKEVRILPRVLKLPEDKVKKLLISNIEYECSIRDISRERQRLITQCSQPTYDKKRKDPGEFTVNELLRFAKKFNVPIESLFLERVVKNE